MVSDFELYIIYRAYISYFKYPADMLIPNEPSLMINGTLKFSLYMSHAGESKALGSAHLHIYLEAVPSTTKYQSQSGLLINSSLPLNRNISPDGCRYHQGYHENSHSLLFRPTVRDVYHIRHPILYKSKINYHPS